MDSRVKQLWIAALESGEYQQARGALRKEDGFCCLGVLCDLYRKDTGLGAWTVDDNEEPFFTGVDFDGQDERETVELPQTVWKWAGLKDSAPVLDRPINNFGGLIEMNDGGMNFEQIAEVIKVQL